MTNVIINEHINYLELPAKNIIATKMFFSKVFNWIFTDYGDEYSAFSSEEAGINGGFYKSKKTAKTKNGSVLIVIYSTNLVKTQNKIIQTGGIINKAIFSFPGEERFHFLEPSNNEFAVWSDK